MNNKSTNDSLTEKSPILIETKTNWDQFRKQNIIFKITDFFFNKKIGKNE